MAIEQKVNISLSVTQQKDPFKETTDSAGKLNKSVKEVEETSKKASKSVEETGTSLNKQFVAAAQSLRGIGQIMQGSSLSTQMTGWSSAVGGTTKMIEGMGTAGGAALVAIGAAAAAAAVSLYALVKATEAGLDVLKEAAIEGVKFAASMDTAKYNLASVTANLVRFRDEEGNVVEGEAHWQASLELSQERLKQLAVISRATGQDLQKMMDAYISGAPAMNRAGIALEKQIELMQRLSIVAKAAQLPEGQFPIEVRQSMEGDVRRSRLLQMMGITQSAYNEAKKAGELEKLFFDRSESFMVAQKANLETLNGLIGLMKTNIQQTLGEGFQPLYEVVVSISKEFLRMVQSPEFKDLSREIGTNLAKALENSRGLLTEIVPLMAKFVGLLSDAILKASELAKWLAENKKQIYLMAAPPPIRLAVAAYDWAKGKLDSANRDVDYGMPGSKLPTGIATGYGDHYGPREGGTTTPEIKPTPLDEKEVAKWEAINAEMQGIYEKAVGINEYERKMAQAATEYRAELKKINDLKTGPEGDDEHDAAAKNALRAKAREILRAKELAAGQENASKILKLDQDVADKEAAIGADTWDRKIVLLQNWAGRVMDAYSKLNIKNTEFEKKQLELDEFVFGERMKNAKENWDYYVEVVAKAQAEISAITEDEYQKKVSLEDVRSAANLERIEKDIRLWGYRKDEAIRLENERHNTVLALYKKEEDSIVGFRRRMAETTDQLLKYGTTSAVGVSAAMSTIFTSLRTEAEKTFDYVTSLFGSLGGRIETSIYEALTGNQNFFKNFFKGIADDFSKSIAKSFKDDLMPAVKDLFGQLFPDNNMGPYPAGPNGQEARPTGMSGTQKWGVAGLAALGSIAQMSSANTLLGNPIAQAGISIGLALASTGIGVVVGAIVAAVGVIASALTPRPDDKSSSYSGLDMATAIKLGLPVGQEGSERQVAGSKAIELSNNILSWFSDMFKKADPSYSRDILKGFRDQMLTYLKGITVGAHAGSEQDWKADIDKIFTSVLPKELMHQFFGQQTYTIAEQGGITGTGMKFGDVTRRSGVDANSPLVQFLTNLGFSIEKVNEIANQIDTMAPEEWQKWFSGIVGVVIDFGNNIKNLSKSFEEIFADIEKSAHPDVVKNFRDTADALVQTAEDLSLYTGQTQIDKANELNQLSAEYYSQAVQALTIIKQLIDQIAQQAANFQLQATSYMKTPDWLAADRRDWLGNGKTTGIYSQQLAGTTDTATIQQLWNDFITDATAQMNYLIGIINQAKAGMKEANRLATDFHNIMANASKETTVYSLWEDVLGLQTKLGKAQKLSGQEQIDALNEINASAADLYNSLLGIIQGINNAEKSIHKSIQSQIWENSYGLLKDNDSRIAAINQQVGGLMDSIKFQLSSDAISSTASEVQGMVSRYLSLFPADSPGRSAAVAEANRLLEALDKQTHARLEELRAQAQRDADEAERIMKQTSGAFQTAMEKATTELRLLTQAVTDFKTAVDTKLKGTAESIETELKRVAAALKTAMENFTKALGGDPTNPNPGPGPGPATPEVQNLGIAANSAIGDENTGLKGFTLALNEAISVMKGA